MSIFDVIRTSYLQMTLFADNKDASNVFLITFPFGLQYEISIKIDIDRLENLKLAIFLWYGSKMAVFYVIVTSYLPMTSFLDLKMIFDVIMTSYLQMTSFSDNKNALNVFLINFTLG